MFPTKSSNAGTWLKVNASAVMLLNFAMANSTETTSPTVPMGAVTMSAVREEMKSVMTGFVVMWENCFMAGMSGNTFPSDNLEGFFRFPSRTTVGVGRKFSKNRRFFANLVDTRQFRSTLARDLTTLKGDLVQKMTFCKEAIMDERVLKIYYLDSDWSNLQSL